MYTPGLHNKIPAYNIFVRGWVAQKSFVSQVVAKIFQGLGPKRRESSNGDRVYVCSLVGVHVYIHTYMHKCINAYIYIYTYTYTHISYSFISLSLSLYIYIYIHTYIHKYIHTYIYIHTYMYMCMCIYIYIYMLA